KEVEETLRDLLLLFGQKSRRGSPSQAVTVGRGYDLCSGISLSQVQRKLGTRNGEFERAVGCRGGKGSPVAEARFLRSEHGDPRTGGWFSIGTDHSTAKLNFCLSRQGL